VTTDELIVRLRELDPEGAKEVYLELGDWGPYVVGSVGLDYQGDVILR